MMMPSMGYFIMPRLILNIKYLVSAIPEICKGPEISK